MKLTEATWTFLLSPSQNLTPTSAHCSHLSMDFRISVSTDSPVKNTLQQKAIFKKNVQLCSLTIHSPLIENHNQSRIKLVLPTFPRRIKLAVHVGHMGERRGVYRVLVGKPEGKKPLGRTRRRWKYNIKMDLQEGRCGGYGLDRAGSEYWQVAGCCEFGNELSGSVKGGEFLD